MLQKSILVFFICSLALAEAPVRRGVGRFYARDEDSFSFVKSQLLSKAFEDVLSVEMEEMGLKKDLFWENYNTKFEEEFAQIDEKLKKRYKIDNGASYEQKKSYKKSTRIKKLLFRSRFGNLKKAIVSYSVKNLSRSSENPKSKYMVVEAKVDRAYLGTIYRNFISGGFEGDQVEKIYISLNLVLKNGEWSKLGVNYSTDLQTSVQKSWLTWFQNKLGFKEDQIVFTTDSLEQNLQEKANISTSLLGPLNIFSGSSEESASIWMKLNYYFEILEDNPLLRERKIQMNSDFLAYHVGSSIPLHYADFPVVRMLHSYSSIEQLSSDIASKIYELPLKEYMVVKKKMRTNSVNMQYQEVVVASPESMLDVLNLMEFFREDLIRFQPVVQFDSFSMDKAKIVIQYQGKPEDLKGSFFNFSSKAKVGGKKISFPNQENPFTLVLKGDVSPQTDEG